MSDQDRLIGFVQGFLVGGITASVVSLLYAPKSGKKLRKDIRKTSSNLLDEAESKFSSVQKEADKILGDVDKRISKIRKDAESTISDIEKKMGDLKSKVSFK